MKDLRLQGPVAERNRDRLALIQELVREAAAEMALARSNSATSEAPDRNEWERTQRLAQNIAARAQALDLGVLASCARELERFAGAVAAGGPAGHIGALQGAAIAIETIDLELSVLSKSYGLT
jgi:hypothetical protein